MDLFKEFGGEFVSEEDADRTLDEIIMSVGKSMQEEDNQPSILNIQTVKKVAYVYKLMKFLLRGTGAKVEYKLNEPFKSMGSVSVIGKQIPIQNVNALIEAAKLASSYDVFVKTDKTVEMDFTFHELAIS
jgi:hypothetical protein